MGIAPYGGFSGMVKSSCTGKQGFPGGGNRRLVRRKTALFSPLDWGVGLSSEHAAGERCSPLRWVVAGWGWILPVLFLGRGDVGIAPYDIPLSPMVTSPFSRGTRANNVRPYIAYRKTGIPRRGEQAACPP